MKLLLKALISLFIFFLIFTGSLLADSIEDRLNIVSESGDDEIAADVNADNTTLNANSSNEAVTVRKVKAELPPPAAEDKILLESALNYFSNGDYAASLMKTEELISTYPVSLYIDQAVIIRSKILAKKGDYNSAAAELSKISKESGEYPQALYLLAGIFRNAKDMNNAREMYLKLTSMFPANELADDSLLNLGDIYLSAGQSEKALETAVSVIKNYADRETVDDAWFLLGKIYMQDRSLRDLQKAREVFKKFIYKADVEKDPYFAKSPLLNRVRINYAELNNYYFSGSR